jgi:hypothetical protein
MKPMPDDETSNVESARQSSAMRPDSYKTRTGKCRRENCQVAAQVSVPVGDEVLRLCDRCAGLFWQRLLVFKSGF